MGWTFSQNATKRSLRAEIVAPEERACGGYFRTLASAVRGNTLWCLHESKRNGEALRFIGCYRFGRHQGWWGYKAMDETMGPYYYDCPIEYLDAASPAQNSMAAVWRAQVRERARANGSSQQPLLMPAHAFGDK